MSRALVARIVCHDEFIGKVWYLIRLTQASKLEELYFLKRYEDFKELHWNLDAVLKGFPAWGNEGMLRVLPELPELGRGIMQKFSLMGMGDWADRFRESMQNYLDQILVQIHDLEDEPVLKCFFGPPVPKVKEDEQPALLVRFRGLVERSKSFGGQRLNSGDSLGDVKTEVKTGSTVRLANLRNATAFNGLLAQVVSVTEQGQFKVRLGDGQVKVVGADNVRQVDVEAKMTAARTETASARQRRTLRSRDAEYPAKPVDTRTRKTCTSLSMQPSTSVEDFLAGTQISKTSSRTL